MKEKKHIHISYQKVFRSSIFVDKIRVEDVELVALYNLRRRIVHVVVGLIVFVPLEAGVHAIEITRLTRSILVGPEINLRLQRRLDAELRFVRAHALARLPMHRLLLARQYVLNLPAGAEHLLSRVLQSLIVLILLRDERTRLELRIENVIRGVAASFILAEGFE